MSSLPVVWAPEYEVDIGPHVFPTSKYRLVRRRLLDERALREAQFHRPAPATRGELLRVHGSGYLDRALKGALTRREELLLELPFSPALLKASLLCCGGTLLAGRMALEAGVAVHLGGGFHHAFPDHGEGFCLLNDVAVAAAGLRAEGRVRRVAVVDLDVHQGNGTAAIFRSEPEVYTFSMHQEGNYPFPKPASDLDVGLPDGIEDERYHEILDESLHRVVDEGRPEVAVYLAGADPYESDQLGGLALSLDGLALRDRRVLERFGKEGIPVAVVLAGGYARRLADTVEIHCNTVREAARFLEGC
jgi:acetoin utilization deacetylase AcuC-like enzyme